MPKVDDLGLNFKQLVDQFNKLGKANDPVVCFEQPKVESGQLECKLVNDPTILLVAGGTSLMNQPMQHVNLYYSAGSGSKRHTQVFATLFDVVLPKVDTAQKTAIIERINWDLANFVEIQVDTSVGTADRNWGFVTRGILNNGQMRCVEIRRATSPSALQVIRR
jgi:hypothetical protein